MRIAPIVLVAPLALTVLVSCSTMNLSTDFDKSNDFTRYKTFDLMPGNEMKSYLQQERLEDAVVAALADKGFSRAATGADFFVALHGRVDTHSEVTQSSSFGYAAVGWGYWAPYGYSGTTATTTARQVPLGTLVLDIVDASTRKLVWQAVASDTLTPHASADSKVSRLNSAIKRVLASFPPKPR
jgi:hypothetical protein